jgi:hypothetical protein
MMALGFFMWFILMALLSLAACANLPLKTESLVRRLYVASPANGGADANSGGKDEPLATIEAALGKISEMNVTPEMAVIIIRGETTQNVTIEDTLENYPHIILRGDSRRPGILEGTITVGAGAKVTLGKDLTVTGTGRGIVVAGGSFNLEGGTIADNVSQKNGAGVYMESGVFVMKSGTIRDNTAVKSAGGGVYVESGDFVMFGGRIIKNVSSGAMALGRAGGGVYVSADTGARFSKTGGGVISDNRVTPGYRGGQVHVQAGHNSKAREKPVQENTDLYSDDNLNWDSYGQG